MVRKPKPKAAEIAAFLKLLKDAKREQTSKKGETNGNKKRE